jgi:hypothetical protein
MSSLEISASSDTATVRAWLILTHESHVLHVFDPVCNLINQHGDVLSIVTPQIGNGPFNLVVEDDICFSEQLSLEAEVSTSPTQLYLGDLLIHTANARIWNPCPDWQTLHAQRDHIIQQLNKVPITDYLNPPGLDTPFAKIAQGYSTGAQSLVSNLSLALVKADISSARKIASQLAGLGIGLTPAGDDYIMGALYAAWIIHPPEVAKVLAQEVATTAAPLTTSLSAAWLRSAGQGEAGVLWHRFLEALSVSRLGNPSYIQERMNAILAVGETSGSDALEGFLGPFTYWGKHCSNL